MHGDDGGGRVDAQPSLAKGLGAKKGSLLLQSSPGHHLLPPRPCLERAAPHKCLGIRGNYIGGRNRGGGGGMEGGRQKKEWLGIGIQSWTLI